SVRAAEDNQPLQDVMVRALGTSAFTFTDARGFFRLDNLPKTKLDIVFERIGVVRELISVELKDDETKLNVALRYVSFKSAEVVVTARENAQGGELGTTSRIERSAIEHVQGSSLADVLQLLPGQLAQNPTLAGVRQSLLRQAPLSVSAANPSAADRANALGTAIVLDGVPLSNNANLQTNLTILNAAPGTLPPFASAEGRGLDLRQFSADNIESIEVIRGIPSARHGDLTVGAILVQTRASAYKPQARLRLNPQTFESSLSAGWALFDKRTNLTAELNFTRSQDDPRRTEETFSRLIANLAWSQQWDNAARLTSTLRTNFYTTIDERQQFERDQQQITRFAQDRGLRTSLFSVLRFDDDARTKLEWTASLNYTEQVGRFQELITRADGRFPLSDATSDTTKPGIFGDIEYLNRTSVQGLPLNLYSRLELVHKARLFGFLHQFFSGFELRYDQNRGEGRVFDIFTPPRQNYSVGERPRPFSDIPALTQLGFYLEDRIAADIFGKSILVQLGARFDNIEPQGLFRGTFGEAISPRLNATVEVIDGIWLRGGYGVTVKSPTLSQLYPERKYFDLVGFNYFAPNPAERLVMITTRVIEPKNPNARYFSATKTELGLDVSISGVTAKV
ncbi:MAG: TonB-dependent receptor domain-containing protein, partial [Candidatus Thermochlorobacter sp.]